MFKPVYEPIRKGIWDNLLIVTEHQVIFDFLDYHGY